MKLAVRPPVAPMEALSVAESPVGSEWQYEPKWDGFRCLVFRSDDDVYLQSKSGQPLARYFPDLVHSLRQLPVKQFVLDGEIVIPIAGRLSFDDLLMRVHPAESRVQNLAAEHPAMFVAFDLLLDEHGVALTELQLAERRRRLEKFARHFHSPQTRIYLSPVTTDLVDAQKWFKRAGGNLDGIVAKRVDLPYRSGLRDGMQKIKHRQTADCVVGGFRYAENKPVVGSLLLGLYDKQGLLNHVGFTSSFKSEERAKITKLVERFMGSPGFTGRAPGGPSRWSTRRSSEWEPLKTKLVVEVEYDHFSQGRFRHGTRFLRWRPDKEPSQCSIEQVARRRGSMMRLLEPA